MKIGVLTYHSSHNYGAFLQSYALVHALREITSYDVEIIDFSMLCAAKKNKEAIQFNRRQIESIPYNWKRYKMFNRSKFRYLPLSSECCVSDDLDEFVRFIEKKYDAIIVGSDEVWKLDGFRGFPNPYWLPNITDCYKISYAASARNLYETLSDNAKSQAYTLSKDFDYIGVRDYATIELMKKIVKGEKEIHDNCDPTFAYDYKSDAQRGKEILKKKFHIDPSKKCLGLMCGVPALAKKIVSSLNDEYEIVSLYYFYRNTKGYNVIDPFEWVDVIAALDGLVTTFFHGMVFAIKSNTPFIAIENREIDDISYSKSYDILSKHGLEENCILYKSGDELSVVKRVEQFAGNVKSGNKVDYTHVCSAEKKKFQSFVSELVDLMEKK